MFVLHWSQYTCGRFALPQSRHRCTSVTKSMRLNWFRRLRSRRRRHFSWRLGTAMSANGPSGVAASPSSAQRCSGTANSGATDADSGWGRAVGRQIESPTMLPDAPAVGRINVRVQRAVEGGRTLSHTPA